MLEKEMEYRVDMFNNLFSSNPIDAKYLHGFGDEYTQGDEILAAFISWGKN
ncbi:hypothetical protein OROMI_018504 [Orobanche minor]